MLGPRVGGRVSPLGRRSPGEALGPCEALAAGQGASQTNQESPPVLISRSYKKPFPLRGKRWEDVCPGIAATVILTLRSKTI